MIYISWDIGTKNLAYSIIDYSDHIVDEKFEDDKLTVYVKKKTTIIDFDLINLVDLYNSTHMDTQAKKQAKTKANSREKTKLSINEVSIVLLQFLENKFYLFRHCNVIFIENQPSFINPRTKTLSIIIYSFFIQKTLQNIQKVNYLYSDVKLVSPLKKIPGVYEKLSYGKLKKLSISIVTNYMQSDPYSSYKLSTYKKKDDITDCIMYILVHLKLVC